MSRAKLRALFVSALLCVSVSACMRMASTSSSAGPASGQRTARRAFLVRGQPEELGYGVYSYVLFGSPPRDAAQASRYLALIQAYLGVQQLPAAASYVQPWQIALVYLPVITAPPFEASGAEPTAAAQWILANYDYDRAQHILMVLRSDQYSGPYLVSHAKPLTHAAAADQFAFQDMSGVEPNLVGLWMKAFLEQSARERYWERESLKDWLFQLRNTIATAAAIAPQFRQAFEKLFVFVEHVQPKVARK